MLRRKPSSCPFSRPLLQHPRDPVACASDLQRVNRAVDHILRELAQPLSLQAVAAVAGLSPFHFHRVFKAVLGETLKQFVRRQRLERALHQMSHAQPRSLTALALDCGFGSSSAFSRSFRQHFGVPPSAFELLSWRQQRRTAFDDAMAALGAATAAAPQAGPEDFAVQLRDLPARTVAYIRVLDPYRPEVVPAACQRLLAWAEREGLAEGQWLGASWDDPELVAMADCRYDVALVVPALQPAGEIGRQVFPPMRVAEVLVRGDIAQLTRALDWLYKTWLPQSGYVPDELPAFEAWIGKPYAHGLEYFELACQLPVKPAR